MERHVLITGGAGFIGSHLSDALLSRGNRVTVLDIKGPEEWTYLDPAVKVIQADLTETETMETVRALKPEVICHFAANANVALSVSDPSMDARINYLATVDLLKLSAAIGVKKFLFASTGGALSSERTILPTPEHAASAPLSPYAMHKIASERMGEFYRRERGLEFLALRFSNVYGPRQTPTRGEANVIATFAHRMVRQEPTSINGSGLQTRDYVYIDDVIEACVLALEAPKTEGPLNVGSGSETDIMTLHRILAEESFYRSAPTMRPAQPGEPQRSCLDIGAIERCLGWKPKMRLGFGLKKTVEWHLAEVRQPITL